VMDLWVAKVANASAPRVWIWPKWRLSS
jgi:hypothetical protein